MAFELLWSADSNQNIIVDANILTVTPSEFIPQSCTAIIFLGDGTNDLDGSGGDFEITIEIDGVKWLGGPDIQELGNETQSILQTQDFIVPAGSELKLYIKSPNINDTNVYVNTLLYVLDVAGAGSPVPTYELTRSSNDEQDIHFAFPIDGATITGTRKINSGAEESVTGTISESDIGLPGNWYKLEYTIFDRPVEEGYVVYKFTSGIYTVYLVLNVDNEASSLNSELLAAISHIDNKLIGQVILSQPVAAEGQIESSMIIGDDYLNENSRAFQWTIEPPISAEIGSSTCFFGAKSISYTDSFIVPGTIIEDGDNWILSFDVAKEVTEDLKPGKYKWSVEVRDEESSELTQIIGNTLTMINKQT